jgi:hypothetical protein
VKALLALAAVTLTLTARGAVTLFQVETFETLGGWTSGSPNPNPPVVFPDSGPLGAGDESLRLTANGNSGAGGKLVTYNRTTWTGDYSSEGITAIAVDLRNLGSNPLFIRLAFTGPGGWWVTAAVTVPAFAGWGEATFDIQPSALQAVSEATNAVTTMAGVMEMRILHSSPADHQGATVSGGLLIDNLTAVPEPSALVLLSMAPLLMRRKRRFAKTAIS